MAWADILNEAAMAEDRPLVCWFVELALTGVTLRLMSGRLADVSFTPGTFISEHATYGMLSSIGELASGAGIETLRPELEILPPTDAAAIALQARCDDGCTVRIWVSPLDRADGQPVGTPQLMFTGEVDVAWLRTGAGSQRVVIECIGAAEALHDAGAGFALNSADHQVLYAGELGLDFVAFIARNGWWGGAMPANTNASGTVTQTKSGVPLTPAQVAVQSDVTKVVRGFFG
jgi:hypothetical protein